MIKGCYIIYLGRMDDQNARQKLTEATEDKPKMGTSISSIIFRALCPCLIKRDFTEENSSQTLSKGVKSNTASFMAEFMNEGHRDKKYSLEIGQKKLSMQTDESSNENCHNHHANSLWTAKGKRSQFTSSAHQRFERYNLQNDAEFLTKSTIKKWHSFPIYQHKENQVMVLGSTKGRMLAVISSIKVEPCAATRKKISKAYPYERMERTYSNSNVDRFWNQRYLLFQKFDEGISLDNQSWSSVTPEPVAEYISNRIRCQTVLDAFCGAGGDSIKLANTCSRVIANDICSRKIQCLINNAKVYCAQNIETLNQNFLTIENIKPDIVYLNPSIANPDKFQQQNCLSNSSFTPPLDKIINKAIQLSKNIVFLLPANTNVSKLAEIVASEYMKAKIAENTCSMKIEKVFFMSQLKYLIVYLGCQVQNDIKLNDELCFVYNLLKDGDKKKPFLHRKIVKRVRQQYGMTSLLNFVFQSQKIDKNSGIQKFYAYLREKQIINEENISKIVKQQNLENQKNKTKKIPLVEPVNMEEEQEDEERTEEEKYVQEEEESEDHSRTESRTFSYYSMGSGKDRLSVGPRESPDGPRESPDGQPDPKRIILNALISIGLERKNTIQFCPLDDEEIQRSSGRTEKEVEKQQDLEQK